MAYTPAQKRVIRAIRREAVRRYSGGGWSKAERRKLRSAFLTGRTEANFLNPNYGDGTSVGWRQETSSSYPSVNRTDVPGSVRRYFNEVDSAYQGQNPSVLAQAVQRSAYPGRYGEHRSEAIRLTKRTVRGKAVSGAPQARRGARSRSVTKLKTVPGVDRSGQRRAALMAYLENRGQPDALLNLASGLRQAVDTPSRLKAVQKTIPGQKAVENVKGKVGRAEGEKIGTLKTLIERANRMNQKHAPYVWGGGHGNAKALGPWDCSGAISRLFRISPRVSGQFASWGKPGKGKHVTVYANSGHVFVEIDGRYFGTSGSNPGGGAGWFPTSHLSPGYLAQFTKRHPSGL